jgi:hypothetical protein
LAFVAEREYKCLLGVSGNTSMHLSQGLLLQRLDTNEELYALSKPQMLYDMCKKKTKNTNTPLQVGVLSFKSSITKCLKIASGEMLFDL